MKQLHSILKDIALFLCVALPIVYCVGLSFVVYGLDNNAMLVSYYAIKVLASISAVTCLCILATKGLGLHLSKRR